MAQGNRILLVEDDLAVASLIADMLEDASYEVDGPYATLSEGVAALADHMPSGAVLDIHLRGSDVDLLADDLDSYAIPYVLCSGAGEHPMVEAHPQALFILKPDIGEKLLSALRHMLH
ncbi:response regulator [Sphingobium amiense]|uniref:Response regulator n=2 Tax=Sphingobium amiense TaxID=135719 RepID=A0A494W9P9_9SPHN|nr:response regulator [Sphingobium amiense]BBD97142.1 response regulator [Sphingobium amiense]